MSRRITVLVLSLAACLPCRASAGNQDALNAPDKPTESGVWQHPHTLTQQEKDHVMLTVEVLDAEKTTVVFTVNLLQREIQPLLLQIDNRSGQTYAFRKADVTEYLPANQVARYAYKDPITMIAQNTKWLAVSAPADTMDWTIKSVLRTRVESFARVTKHKPPKNRDIQADLERMEIEDKAIESKESLIGYVFVHSPNPRSPIKITLTNAKTQAPLVFEIAPEAAKPSN